MRTLAGMDTVTTEVSTRELRNQLSDVLGRAMYAGERIGVTRNGKLAAVVVSVADVEALEEFEMAQDVAAYREAKAADDGARVTLEELRADLTS
ncbi:type II toxin-antitoxin system prevent-host-death family antitoxin [Corynebacterium sp.]|uniref:type II toxin-antitoxin system prevent-host-death family antitoxin n=1 Tax=Corynebacterium sp. TaxID=1720 RepID=UPI0026E022D6|nr:type II toxin-antitoxin system prevent-host-death family antitoxin [Corynebacterium sp.]MDO5513543.1 type II toxin-antitoxin system prevent-host-death family antitoxin [Corynebacterium sp.]